MQTAQPNEAPTPENFGPRLGTSTAGGPSRADSPAGAAAAAAISNLGNPSNFRNRQLDSAAGHEARGSKDVVPAQGQSGTTFQMRNPEPVVEPARGPRVLEMPNLLDGEVCSQNRIKPDGQDRNFVDEIREV